MAKKKYPLYELKKSTETDFVDAIAIVDQPAIQSDFYMFANQQKVQYFVADQPKKMIAGLAMIPDLHIYRVNSEGEEFEVFFSKETIAELRNDFMKNKRNDAVNFMHINNAVPEGVYLVESFIVESELQAKDLKQRFNIDSPIGSWFVQLHCESLELFKQIREYGFHGFSVQGVFDRILIHLNNNQSNNNIMNKLIERFKAVLTEMEAELAETPMEKIAETGQSVKIGKEGEPVMIVEAPAGDPSGQPMETPCPDGQYVLENGDTIECKGGMLVSRVAMAAPAEPQKPVEDKPKESTEPTSGDTKTTLADYPWDTCIADQLAAGYDQATAEAICGKIKSDNMTAEDAITALGCKKKEDFAVTPSGDTAPVVPDQTPEVSAKTLGELVDVGKDGEYYIEVKVSGGKITEASVQAEQALIKEQFATAVNTIEAQKTEIALLKSQLKLPITKPIINPEVKKFSKEELQKMTPYERLAVSKGMRIIK